MKCKKMFVVKFQAISRCSPEGIVDITKFLFRLVEHLKRDLPNTKQAGVLSFVKVTQNQSKATVINQTVSVDL
jgi:hypothetical protein